MRYIDAEELTDYMLERYNELCDKHGDYDHYTTGYGDAIDAIENSPTADAVPKSEVEELQAKVARLRKENTELLVSKETDIHISMEKLVKVRTEHPIFKAIEEKVAREIFEEIDEIMANIEIYVSDRERTNFEIGAYKCHASISLKIAELKKKYTEETE